MFMANADKIKVINILHKTFEFNAPATNNSAPYMLMLAGFIVSRNGFRPTITRQPNRKAIDINAITPRLSKIVLIIVVNETINKTHIKYNRNAKLKSAKGISVNKNPVYIYETIYPNVTLPAINA